MANSVCEVLLTRDPLTETKSETAAGAGAIVEFAGVVRELENEREIAGIEYEAHIPMAEHQLRLIAQQAVATFGLECVLIQHRYGFVAVGEASLWLRVAAAHRAPAFEASKWIVDELKQRVPIWKRPRFKIDSRTVRTPRRGVQSAQRADPTTVTAS